MNDALLVLNIGSSSLKFCLYDDGDLDVLWRGEVSDIGGEVAARTIAAAGGFAPPRFVAPSLAGHEAAIDWLLGEIARAVNDRNIRAVGHRVVHGGAEFARPVIIDDDIFARLAALSPLAPAHQPFNLAGIRTAARRWPAAPQVACFDTSFHRTQPRLAQLFALPQALTDGGILRYGFHGLSYEYIAGALREIAGGEAPRRAIVAHLGAGASMCALKDGVSIATTMGYTALDGLMMATRCGEIDPGVVLHLLDQGRSVDEVRRLLGEQSGMLGVSGLSGDVRDLLASSDPKADEALDLFAYRAARAVGSLAAALGGLDALVFTAGIGENAPDIRRRICDLSEWAGVAIDSGANQRNNPRISADASKVGVYVARTNEEIVIARATRRLIAKG